MTVKELKEILKSVPEQLSVEIVYQSQDSDKEGLFEFTTFGISKANHELFFFQLKSNELDKELNKHNTFEEE